MDESRIENKAALKAEDDQFIWNKGFCNLKIQNDSLLIKTIKPFTSKQVGFLDSTIKLINVISTTCATDDCLMGEDGRPLPGTKRKSCLGQQKTLECFAIIVNFWIKGKQHRRRLKSIKLLTSSEKSCTDWHDLIQLELSSALKKEGQVRPRSLLVLINPYGGKKTAVSLYNKIVAPLFKMAEIKASVVITEYAGHAKDYVEDESNNISSYDGVIVVGGDGMFNEAANGILIAEQRKRNIFLDGKTGILNEPIRYAKPSIKLGLIPAGSANFLSWVSQGVADIETSAIQIVCGERHPVDFASTHDENGNFFGFSSSSTNYGFIPHMVQSSESLRFLGPKRYDLTTLKLILKNPTYPCEVCYLESSDTNPVDVKSSPSKCGYPCEICMEKTSKTRADSSESQSQSNSSNGEQPSPSTLVIPTSINREISTDSAFDKSTTSKNTLEQQENTPSHSHLENVFTKRKQAWKVVRGRFHMVNAFSNANIYDKSPNGLAPFTHLADGTADLVMVHATSRGDFVNHIKTIRGTGNPFDFPFVEVHRVKGYHFRAISENDLEEVKEDEREEKSGKYRNLSITSESTTLPTSEGEVVPEPHHIWSNDGEVKKGNSCTGWIHRGLLDIFAKGIERE